MSDGGGPVVLVVDDDRDVADLYSEYLAESYEVRTAYGGEEALELADDDVSVVLLDRRMPDRSGDEVLEALRERGFEGQVVLLTAVSPDVDVVEMGLDDYVVKPASPAEIEAVVSRMVSLEGESEPHREFAALVSKKLAIESRLGTSDLQASEEYQGLLQAIEQRRQEIGPEVATRLMADASAAVFGGMDRGLTSLPTIGDDASAGSGGDAPAADAGAATDEAPAGDAAAAGAPADASAGTTSGGEAAAGAAPAAGARPASVAPNAPERYVALRAADGLFRSLFDGLPDCVFVVGPDRTIVDCNPAFCEQFGYAPADVHGEAASVLFPGGESPMGADGPATLDFERADGSVFAGETAIVHLQDGGTTVATAAVVRPA